LPQRVYRRRNAFYWFPPKEVAEALGKTAIKLGKTFPEAMAKYAEFVESPVRVTTMNDLFDRYMIEVAPKKAPQTYRGNLREVEFLRVFFGAMRPQDITQVDVYSYLDNRGALVRGNREKALLSHVFSMAIQWGVVKDNPCRGVKRNPERRRDHYVEDADFGLVWEEGGGLVRGMMDLGLITGLRKGDLLGITLQDIQTGGLYVEINKSRRLGGPMKKVLFEWTPELRRIIESIRALPRPVRGMHLFCTRKGQPYSDDGFDSIWQRTVKKVVAKNPDFVRFRFNDIRHKAATHAEQEHGREFARRLLVHADQKTTDIYVSGVQKVKPLR
jgi:integrase